MDVLGLIGNEGHPEEENLERYIMNLSSDPERDAIEAHLQVCKQCGVRLNDAKEWVCLMKTNLPLVRNRREVPNWRGVLSRFLPQPVAWAAGCAALAAILLTAPPLLRRAPIPEQLLNLSATRGEKPPSGVLNSHALGRLRLDTTDLTEPLDGQVVDTSGTEVWSQPITPASPEIRLPRPLDHGIYWVRINSRQDHATIREFRIEVR